MIPTWLTRLSPLALAFLLGACDEPLGKDDPSDDPSDDTQDTDEEVTVGDLTISRWSDVGGPDGLLKVEIDIPPGTTSFMLTGEAEVASVGIEYVYDPNGDLVLAWSDWWNGDQALTWAFYAYDKTTAFNWPIRGVDGPLTPGTWTIDVWFSDGPSSNYVTNVPVDLTLHRKADADLTQGDVHVDIWFAEGVDEDPDVVAGVEQAVDRWGEVWAAHGLGLKPTWRSTSIDPSLEFALNGDPDVEALAAQVEDGKLVLIVGESIGSTTYYGLAGGIPGTLVPSPLTWTVISWLAHAGVDGVLQPDETRLMGETMAHELGHYMGLFHPVEMSLDRWDALSDTPDCTTSETCEAELGSNIMFPYSLCSSGTCLPQGDMTAQQSEVLHRYTGTL